MPGLAAVSANVRPANRLASTRVSAQIKVGSSVSAPSCASGGAPMNTAAPAVGCGRPLGMLRRTRNQRVNPSLQNAAEMYGHDFREAFSCDCVARPAVQAISRWFSATIAGGLRRGGWILGFCSKGRLAAGFCLPFWFNSSTRKETAQRAAFWAKGRGHATSTGTNRRACRALPTTPAVPRTEGPPAGGQHSAERVLESKALWPESTIARASSGAKSVMWLSTISGRCGLSCVSRRQSSLLRFQREFRRGLCRTGRGARGEGDLSIFASSR
jgi:hypothetical protein